MATRGLPTEDDVVSDDEAAAGSSRKNELAELNVFGGFFTISIMLIVVVRMVVTVEPGRVTVTTPVMVSVMAHTGSVSVVGEICLASNTGF